MMAIWSGELHLTEPEVAMTVVSYFDGCVLTLFFFARFSQEPNFSSAPPNHGAGKRGDGLAAVAQKRFSIKTLDLVDVRQRRSA